VKTRNATPEEIEAWAAAHERMLGRLASPVMLRLVAGNARRMAVFCADRMNRWDLALAWRAAATALNSRADAIERKQ
jgi:hypothetical protein